ncbi:[protein-PII] uridylyltransferase, partial [uncultured Roseovarius sp.]|uniref:[protein-PII] uridylyltransferase n=1 Tax=uncultured Roseovarius sp. TaxID=293344 RepID=UPI0025E8FFEC
MTHIITRRDDLICPADDIFDLSEVETRLAQAISESGSDMSALRHAVVNLLGAEMKRGRAAIAAAFAEQPFEARPVTRAYCWLTDCVILTTLDVATRVMHPLPNPTEAERLAVFAVGGYGRGEMAPQSDVDLLFLTPYKITPWAESVIESMLYILWDLRLKVGHASRTIRDCLRLGADDYTIRTALLENRHLAGDAKLASDLNRRLWADLFKGTERDFTEAKLAERDARHEKQGERYMVEPNVKEGKGGLRDLQSLFWIAKYLHGVTDVSELVALGMFTDDEFNTFVKAETFLWAVRCHLHLITGRPNDQLTFDMQVEVAERMKYSDTAGRRGVEVFMQDYFRHATAVGDLTRIFLTKLEASHIKSEPILQRLFRRRKKLKDGYTEVHGRLAILDDDAFLSEPLNLLRLFEEGLRTGLLIHPDAMLLVTANLNLINDEMRNDPRAHKLFLDLLLKHGNPERALRRMNELGILSAFLPEFEPIVAMMQFNMYHHYTVDEHIIQCISHLAQIERNELIEELPVSSTILKEGLNRRVLYVALLLHDIGKGRDEDHSILGARIARKVAPRLGLKPKEVDTVEWLVRYHLLMSDMAQKRDIADPRTVRGFAKAVQSVKRLDLLLVLTVCDIRGVGPDTWNNWKAVLLRALYNQ